jgi:tetratricopeptide (TPR) repeat protein
MRPVYAADQVVTRDETLFGKIESLTPEVVRLLPRGSTDAPREIGVADVLLIQFDDEPQGLIEAKRRLVKKEFVSAFHAVKEINENQLKSSSVAIRGEYAYVQAVVSGRIAIKTAEEISFALRRVKRVIDQFTRSIHYYELLELAGDLEVALGEFDKAKNFYDKMIEGPPLMAIRARRLGGNCLAAEGRHLEAIAEFENLQLENLDSNGVEQEKMAACLGQATSLIALSRFDEAVSLVQAMLSRDFPEEVPISSAEELVGKAYSLLGQSFLEMQQNQKALIAYLTVDLVYNTNPDIHAESLLQLIKLWAEGGYPLRAMETREKLVNSYPESVAATQLNSPSG